MDSFLEQDISRSFPVKSEVYNTPAHNNLVESTDVTRRRSSNRSIKRKKFDDELIEYSSQPLPTVKSNRPRSQSHSDYSLTPAIPPAPIMSVSSSGSISTATAPTTVAPPLTGAASVVAGAAATSTLTVAAAASSSAITVAEPSTTIASTSGKRRQSAKPVAGGSSRRNKRSGGGGGGVGGGRQQNHLTTKDLGRWKPIDDLALIIGVQQTNDLRTVHLGTKFSCKFTLQELQQRWYALLYDQAVSRVAVSAMRNLHPDMIAAVQDKALWSQTEEQVLSTIKSGANPALDTFADLLAQHPDVFYAGRTASALSRHWQTMRMYHLLPDQVLGPLPVFGRAIMTFNDAEDIILDGELGEPPDDMVDEELRIQQRNNIKQIRHLENEVGRWNVLVDSVTGVCPGELDGQTLAVLRGRMVRYLMRSKEIVIGRCARGFSVDIDLALEGPAHKISRRQGVLRLRNTGEFYLCAEGKRPFFVDGRPIMSGSKVRLYDNSVVEITCLRFIFNINQDLIRTIHDSLKYNAIS